MRAVRIWAVLLAALLLLTVQSFADPAADDLTAAGDSSASTGEPDPENPTEQPVDELSEAPSAEREEDKPLNIEIETDAGEFFTKSFEDYTVTQGFLLLYLILGFLYILWRVVKGVF